MFCSQVFLVYLEKEKLPTSKTACSAGKEMNLISIVWNK